MFNFHGRSPLSKSTMVHHRVIGKSLSQLMLFSSYLNRLVRMKTNWRVFIVSNILYYCFIDEEIILGGRNQEDVIPNKYSAFLLLFFLDLIWCYNQLLYSTQFFFLHFEGLIVVPFNPTAIGFFHLGGGRERWSSGLQHQLEDEWLALCCSLIIFGWVGLAAC